MSDELAIIPEGFLTPSKYGTQENHDKVAGSTFLPRIQLMQAMSKLVTKRKAQSGDYCVVQGSETILHNLGDNFNCLVLGYRPKAVRFVAGKMLAYYNPDSEDFKKVEIDEPKTQSGCMYGPEYLVYLPEQQMFVGFHFANPTMRQTCGPMLKNIGKATTCKVEFIEKKFSWYSPVIVGCSTPLQMPEDRAGWLSQLKVVQEKFNNPKEYEAEEGVEAAPADATGTERAR